MIRIIDYNAGNLTSVKRALDYLGIPCEITPDAEKIVSAERVIFPGVGHAGSAVDTMKERGLDSALREAFQKGTPILGICLGTQIILSHSEEGDTDCLGLIPGRVRRFALNDPNLKIPHMGWNEIRIEKNHPVLAGIQSGDEFYFVHSYYPSPDSSEHVLATSEYETRFTAALGSKNLIATQFHPEKSGRVGLGILRDFAKWDGNAC